MSSHSAIAQLPGIRRQFRITPGRGQCTAALADDFHEMIVTLEHDGTTITGFASRTLRAPFGVCPQAEAAARRTFTGLRLDGAVVPAQKPANCTHLYDLAVLAAAHARDAAALVYEIWASDPGEDGLVLAEIRANGVAAWQWRLREDVLIDPAPGLPLRELRRWIATLPPEKAEPARMLQWACMMGTARRLREITAQSTQHLALSCFAFNGAVEPPGEPARERIDFSAQGIMPQASSAGLL